MNAHPLPLRRPAALLFVVAIGAAGGAAAQRAASAPDWPASASAATPTPAPLMAKAGEACESSVVTDLKALRGREAQRIEFSGAKRALSPAQGDEISVKGAGRYSGGSAASSVAFTYGCTYNAKTGSTNGVVISDKGGSAASRPAPQKAWQPDLSRLSPEVCETAVAAFLKERHPRVGKILLGSDSRQLKPVGSERTSLEGQGGVERAPGMSAIAFTYRCEFDNRSGKLVNVQASE